MKTRRSAFACIILLATSLSAPERASAQGGTTASGTSNELNPAISFNGLFVGRWIEGSLAHEHEGHEKHAHGAPQNDGIQAQEFELAMTAVVDPNFKAAAFVAYEPFPDGPEAALAVEEAYLQTTSLPQGFGLRAGRFLLPFGRHNRIHIHQYPFIEAPLVSRELIGAEGAGDVAVEASYSPPVPWYLNLVAVGGDGAVEGIFDAGRSDLALLGRVENLWDLSEAATLEWGLSYLRGPLEEGHLSFYGSDLRVKWVDVRKTHGHAFVWESEVIGRTAPGTEDDIGLFSIARYRMSRRWWIGGGYSLLSEGAPAETTDHELKGQVAFAPSEFSALRLDVVWTNPEEGDSRLGALLQVNFTIGAHPAHGY
jgi:hypothetical protein